MEFIKLFNQHDDYQSYISSSTRLLPNLSYCQNNEDVHLNPQHFFVAKYNVTSTSEDTSLFKSNNLQYIKNMYIDGIKLEQPISSYQFDTIGEHTVKFENWSYSSYDYEGIHYEYVNEYTNLYGQFFNGITSLISIKIPNNITTISDVFVGCINLTKVILPNSLTQLQSSVFEACQSLTSVGGKGTGASVEIPYSLHNIYDSVFRHCRGITEVNIPNYCTSIGYESFRNTGITSIIIPNSVTKIGNGAFTECANLTDVTIGNGITYISNQCFKDCSLLTNVTIGNKCTSIGNSAFEKCISLTDIIIPNNVTYIGEGAFSSCTGLTNISIGSGVTTISSTAFYRTGITSLTIPDNVTEIIGNGTFADCSSLTHITIGSGITRIEGETFEDCISLISVTIYATTPPTLTTNDIFESCISLSKIYVPTESVAAYKAANEWSYYANIIESIP